MSLLDYTTKVPAIFTVVRDQRWHRIAETWLADKEGVWFWGIEIKRQAPGIMLVEVAFKGKKSTLFMQHVESDGKMRYAGMITYPLLVSKAQWLLKIRARQKPIRKTKVALRIAFPKEV